MKINNIQLPEKINHFAYDGCHKIYLLENETDENEAKKSDYSIIPLSKLKETYKNSCPLKFINSWDCEKTFAPQGQAAKFTN